MPPRYPPSLRSRLPWLLLFFQIIFIMVFLFFVSHDYQPDRQYIRLYPAFQDVNVMVFLGFGFLFAFLKKYGFSGIAFNFLVAALGVQWAIILDAFLFHYKDGITAIGFRSLLTGLMSVLPVAISAGALLGKMNPAQLLLMTVLEVTVFTVNRYIMTTLLKMDGHLSMMHAHIFGAYYGLSVSWFLHKPSPSHNAAHEKEKSETTSELFSMLGTLFLWTFWPSYNSLLLHDEIERKNAVYNTYYAIAVSTVTAFSVSVLSNQKGRLEMKHIRNATLAGGVSVGFVAYMVEYPWITMIIGFLAGLISTLGLQYLQGLLNARLTVHDASGVNATFGLPGLLGGLAYALVILVADLDSIKILSYQAVVGVGCLCLTMTLSLAGGLLTGFILKCQLWKSPKEIHFFSDQSYWEFPHLASHL